MTAAPTPSNGQVGKARLIELLKAAERGTFVLDAEVWCAVKGYEFVQWDGAGCVYRAPGSGARGIRHAGYRDVRPYSVSLDAAMDLAERVLPDWEVGLSQRKPRPTETCAVWWFGNLFRVSRPGVSYSQSTGTVSVKAATAPLALCAAILSAPLPEVMKPAPSHAIDDGAGG